MSVFLAAYSVIVGFVFFGLVFLDRSDTGSVSLTVEVPDTVPRETIFILLAIFWPAALIETIIQYLGEGEVD